MSAPPAPALGSAAIQASSSARDGGASEGPRVASDAAAPSTSVREGSMIARTAEDDALLVADEDTSALLAIPLPLVKTPNVKTVALPGRPAAIIVSGRRVFVTIRRVDDDPDERGALLLFERSEHEGEGVDLREVGRVLLPPDAWGLALSPDGSLALVTSAWTHRLSAIDVARRAVLWSVDTAREPRGVTILPSGDTAYVSHLVGSAVTRVDHLRDSAPVVKRVDFPASPMRSPDGESLSASLGYVALGSPTGNRVYFPRHALGALGVDAWFGVPTVDVLLTATDANPAPRWGPGLPATQVASVTGQGNWMPGFWGVVESHVPAMAQPRAAAWRARTETLLVASEGANQLVELDTAFTDPSIAVVRKYGTAGAPSGVVLSADERTAYVFCRSTFDLSVVALAEPNIPEAVAPSRTVHLHDDPLGPDVNPGRQLFYSQLDYVAPDVGCAACHPEGRDDGHTWHEATLVSAHESDGIRNHSFLSGYREANLFLTMYKLGVRKKSGDKSETIDVAPLGIGYPRQTPMLAGRLSSAGPYGWHAESTRLQERVDAGFRLHRWNRMGNGGGTGNAALHLVPFLRKGLVPPPVAKHELTPEEASGKRIYEGATADCARCHGPDGEPKDRSPTALTVLPTMSGFEAEDDPKFKPPNLQFVGGSAPYMHDGRYDSLESLIDDNHDRMGRTAHLTAPERAALIAYLRTL
ncbi:MAG: c-type cytochrome [Polyangiaceae bacterium]